MLSYSHVGKPFRPLTWTRWPFLYFFLGLHLNMVQSSNQILYLQDNYFEEAFKMRNVLEEFLKTHHGTRRPTILGLREHIFTGRLVYFKMKFSSSLFWCILVWSTDDLYLNCFDRVIGFFYLFLIWFFSVSSLAWFMSNQETSFVTIGQRVLADPLR